MSLNKKIVSILKKKKIKLAIAESCTGGLLSCSIASVSGASKVFLMGLVTYSNQAKINILKVPKKVIQKHGAVSVQCCLSMVNNLSKISKSKVCISITGIAGPGGSEYKPEGLVCFAIAQKNSEMRVETIEYGPLGRNNIRSSAVEKAIELLHEELSVT